MRDIPNGRTVSALWGVASRSGFDTTNLTIKGEVYRNDLHEMLVAAGLGALGTQVPKG